MVMLNHDKPEQKRGSLDGCNEPESAQYNLQWCTYKMDIEVKDKNHYIMVKFADTIFWSAYGKAG